MHLLKAFGMTARIVEQDSRGRTFRVRMQASLDSPAEQAEGLGRGVAGMARAFRSLGTEVVVVLGDRIEALAGALAGSLSGLAVVHIHGGELATGQQDDAIRHAISKIAHLHLVATTEAAARLIRMGEAKSRIHRVGAPALDTLYRMKVPGAAWIEDLLGMPAPDGFVIVAQHPAGPDANIEKRHMRQTLRAVAGAGLPALVIWPNSDPGHSGILEAIESPPANLAARVVRSLPHEDFLRACSPPACSSATAPPASSRPRPPARRASISDPARPAGSRTAPPRSTAPTAPLAIAAAIQRALRTKNRLHPHRPTPYGDGRAARRIARAIATLKIDDRLLRKQNSY